MTKDLANTQTTAQNLLKVFVASPYQLQNLSERMRPIQEMGLGGSYLQVTCRPAAKAGFLSRS